MVPLCSSSCRSIRPYTIQFEVHCTTSAAVYRTSSSRYSSLRVYYELCMDGRRRLHSHRTPSLQTKPSESTKKRRKILNPLRLLSDCDDDRSEWLGRGWPNDVEGNAVRPGYYVRVYCRQEMIWESKGRKRGRVGDRQWVTQATLRSDFHFCVHVYHYHRRAANWESKIS